MKLKSEILSQTELEKIKHLSALDWELKDCSIPDITHMDIIHIQQNTFLKFRID